MKERRGKCAANNGPLGMARSKGAVLKYGVDGEEDGSRYDIEKKEGARLKK